MNDNAGTSLGTSGPDAPARGGIAGSMIFSFLLALVLLVLLVASVDPWGVLAATRVLDLLIEGGIVRVHDLHQGIVDGLPKIDYYWQAQDPIDWRLVLISFLFFLGYDILKAVQFDGLARAYGAGDNLGRNMRAYWYGDGLDRFLPFNIGAVGTAEALAPASPLFDRALSAAVVTHGFIVVEILAFAGLGLFLMGWGDWSGELVWALVILAAVYYIVHPGRRHADSTLGRLSVMSALRAIRWMALEDRPLLFRLCLLSIVSFGMLDVGAYILMQAFHSTVVIMAVEAPELLMAIIGGYVAARLIPITPGGFGVFEWGFATTLTIGGADLSIVLVALGILINVMRNLTGGVLMGVSAWWYGVPTSVVSVTNRFAGTAIRRPTA